MHTKINRPSESRGFTLIELSIVLVIIGLIAGGLLVGQELIKAAAIRATMSQVERFNTAVNTFRSKYNALPGDLNAATAAAFGFSPRGQYAGEGDGNGVIQGVICNSTSCNVGTSFGGEVVMFWVDLTGANGLNVNLIPGNFAVANSNAAPTGATGNITAISTPNLDAMLPPAKLGQGNYFYVWSVGGFNYYGLSQVSILGTGIQSIPGLTVQQAYSIDRKMDDGMPQSGKATALYATNTGSTLLWAGGQDTIGVPYTTATSGSSSSCFDNGGVAGPQQYSLGQNTSALNCALSFQFQ